MPPSSELPPEPKLEPASANAPESEPPTEITRMFRRQMENMWRAGTSRAETERWLMRFDLGEHHRYLLDEIYSNARIQPKKRRKGLIGRLRGR